jgi:hypothetical protein
MGLHIRELSVAPVVSPSSIVLVSSEAGLSSQILTNHELFNSLDDITVVSSIDASSFAGLSSMTTGTLIVDTIVVDDLLTTDNLDYPEIATITPLFGITCKNQTDVVFRNDFAVESETSEVIFAYSTSTGKITFGPYTSAVYVQGLNEFLFQNDSVIYDIPFDVKISDRLGEWDLLRNRFVPRYTDDPYSVFFFKFTCDFVPVSVNYNTYLKVQITDEVGTRDIVTYWSFTHVNVGGSEPIEIIGMFPLSNTPSEKDTARLTVQSQMTSGGTLALNNRSLWITRYA